MCDVRVGSRWGLMLDIGIRGQEREESGGSVVGWGRSFLINFVNFYLLSFFACYQF